MPKYDPQWADELGLDPSDPEFIQRIEADAKGCNCDLDYQCFNMDCRKANEQERAYWSKFWTPHMIEAYRPEYDPNFDHGNCGLMCPHPRRH